MKKTDGGKPIRFSVARYALVDILSELSANSLVQDICVTKEDNDLTVSFRMHTTSQALYTDNEKYEVPL